MRKITVALTIAASILALWVSTYLVSASPLQSKGQRLVTLLVRAISSGGVAGCSILPRWQSRSHSCSPPRLRRPR